ncbi:MAG: hypothetical protein ACTSO2_14400, partial [Promethearchaeota archaeon]
QNIMNEENEEQNIMNEENEEQNIMNEENEEQNIIDERYASMDLIDRHISYNSYQTSPNLLNFMDFVKQYCKMTKNTNLINQQKIEILEQIKMDYLQLLDEEKDMVENTYNELLNLNDCLREFHNYLTEIIYEDIENLINLLDRYCS